MSTNEGLDRLRAQGRMRWVGEIQAWRAEPDDVVGALTAQGFEECKRETARAPRGGVTGGVWQGLDPRTGVVAATVWFHHPATPPTVFIEIDGRPFTEG